MKKGSGRLGVIVLFLGFSLHSGPEFPCPPEDSLPNHQQQEAIERTLFELVNLEREKEGLSPLRLSAELAVLARRHSADMAESGKLSHISVSGDTYEARLVGADFFFSGAGENVARSETTVVEFVHRSLMESSDHRRNILGTDFNTIGIGVVANRETSAFFATQDFIRALEPLSSETAETQLAEKIQEWRKTRSLPQLIFQGEANPLARNLAEARAGEKPLPPIPSSLGETHVYFVTTPSLQDIEFQSLHLDSPFYYEGGLGVSFGRLKNYPGGAFCVALVLFPKYENLSLSCFVRERGLGAGNGGDGAFPELMRKHYGASHCDELSDEAISCGGIASLLKIARNDGVRQIIAFIGASEELQLQMLRTGDIIRPCRID
jgi:uncharacterized protein YkwD